MLLGVKSINRLDILEKPLLLPVPSQNLSLEHRWSVRVWQTQSFCSVYPTLAGSKPQALLFVPHFRDPIVHRWHQVHVKAHGHLLMVWIWGVQVPQCPWRDWSQDIQRNQNSRVETHGTPTLEVAWGQMSPQRSVTDYHNACILTCKVLL